MGWEFGTLQDNVAGKQRSVQNVANVPGVSGRIPGKPPVGVLAPQARIFV